MFLPNLDHNKITKKIVTPIYIQHITLLTIYIYIYS
nr:MAG TPA: hypothetical protein [Caudoviricetes sp.]